MKLRPRIRVFKKVRLAPSRRQFAALPRKGNSWIWDPRPGTYSIEWWDGPQRRRQAAGTTPAEALNAVRYEQWELDGRAVLGPPPSEESPNLCPRQSTSAEARAEARWAHAPASPTRAVLADSAIGTVLFTWRS